MKKPEGFTDEQWEQCYITDDGQIFTPQYDYRNNKVVATGREAYDEWMAAQADAIPPM